MLRINKMNTVETLFELVGYPVKGKIDTSQLEVSSPVKLTNLTGMINTKVRVKSEFSLVVLQYERRDIGKLVKFSHHAVKVIGQDPVKLQSYLKEYYDITLALSDFKIINSTCVIEPTCYLYVGKAKIVGNNDPMLFNVTDTTYCKISTALNSLESLSLYEILVADIPNFKSIDVGDVNSLFSHEIKERSITITLMDHVKIKFINGAIDG
jgi:hypothetical protein